MKKKIRMLLTLALALMMALTSVVPAFAMTAGDPHSTAIRQMQGDIERQLLSLLGDPNGMSFEDFISDIEDEVFRMLSLNEYIAVGEVPDVVHILTDDILFPFELLGFNVAISLEADFENPRWEVRSNSSVIFSDSLSTSGGRIAINFDEVDDIIVGRLDFVFVHDVDTEISLGSTNVTTGLTPFPGFSITPDPTETHQVHGYLDQQVNLLDVAISFPVGSVDFSDRIEILGVGSSLLDAEVNFIYSEDRATAIIENVAHHHIGEHTFYLVYTIDGVDSSQLLGRTNFSLNLPVVSDLPNVSFESTIYADTIPISGLHFESIDLFQDNILLSTDVTVAFLAEVQATISQALQPFGTDFNPASQVRLQWRRNGVNIPHAYSNLLLTDFNGITDIYELGLQEGTYTTSHNVGSLNAQTTGNYTLAIYFDDLFFAESHEMELRVLGLGSQGYYEWLVGLNFAPTSTLIPTTQNVPATISGTANTDIVLVDFRSLPLTHCFDNTTITVNSDVEMVVFRGSSSHRFNNLFIVVAGAETQLVLHDFHLTTSITASSPVIRFIQGSVEDNRVLPQLPALISVGQQNDIIGVTTSVASQAAVIASGALGIYGNADINIENETESSAPASTSGQIALQVGTTLRIYLENAQLTAIGGNGRPGLRGDDGTTGDSRVAQPRSSSSSRGATGQAGGHGTNGTSGTSGGHGGHGAVVHTLILAGQRGTAIEFIGGNGAHGGDGGVGGAGGAGGRGGHGRNSGALHASSAGGHGGIGGNGGNGAAGGAGGNGGDPLFLSGSGGQVLGLGAPMLEVTATVGVGANGGRGGNAGRAGAGGNGGDAGNPSTRWQVGGYGGDPGAHGTPGQGGSGGRHGSLRPFLGAPSSSGNQQHRDPAQYYLSLQIPTVSAFTAQGGAGGDGAASTSGGTRGASSFINSIALGNSNRRNMENNMPTRVFGRTISPRPATPVGSRGLENIIGTNSDILLSFTRAGVRFDSPSISPSSVAPREYIFVTISASGFLSDNQTGSDPYAQVIQNMRNSLTVADTDDYSEEGQMRSSSVHLIELRHSRDALPMEILSVSPLRGAGSDQEYFTVTVSNPLNTTGSPITDESIGVFQRANVNAGWSSAGRRNEATYTNMPVIWATPAFDDGVNISAIRLAFHDADSGVLPNTYGEIYIVYPMMGAYTFRVEYINIPTFDEYINFRAFAIVDGQEQIFDSGRTYASQEREGQFEGTINIGYLDDAIRFPEYHTFMRVEFYPQDYNWTDNPNLRYDTMLVETFLVSHNPPATIRFLHGQHVRNTTIGSPIDINFFSPTHANIMVAGGYELLMWELSDEIGSWNHDVDRGWWFELHPVPFARFSMDDLLYLDGMPTPEQFIAYGIAPITVPASAISWHYHRAAFTLDTAHLPSMSTQIGIDLLPRYMIHVAFTDSFGNLESDTAYLILRQEPLSLNLMQTTTSRRFTDEVQSVTYAYFIGGTGAEYEVNVIRNSEPFYAFDFENGLISVFPEIMSGSGRLIDVYQINLLACARRQDGQGYFTEQNTATFYVYNSDALQIRVEQGFGIHFYDDGAVRFDNNPDISQLDSDGILALDRIIDRSAIVGIDLDYDWQSSDTMFWHSDDHELLSLNVNDGGWWVSLENFPMSLQGFRPNSDFLAIGHQPGETTIGVRHERTGMVSEINFSVDTLFNRLFLISIIPGVSADVIYYSAVDGSRVYAETDGFGRIAIYEEHGITGYVRFRAEVGNGANKRLYLGSIHSSELVSGEGNPQFRELYPMNNVSLRPVSNQTFYTFLPNGMPYSGTVSVWGGLFVNGVYIPDSIFPIPDPLNPGTEQVGNGGSFTISMDTERFGDIGITDDLKFVYEIHFDESGWAPELIIMQGFLNNDSSVRLGEAIINLRPYNAQGFTVLRHTLIHPDAISNITNHSTFVGPSEDFPRQTLTSLLVAPIYFENVRLTYSDTFGFAPRAQAMRQLYPNAEFMSGLYSFWEVDLDISEGNLQITRMSSRSYEVEVRASATHLQRISLPFQLFNAVGLNAPDEYHEFSLDIDDDLPTDTSNLGDVINANSNDATPTAAGLSQGIASGDDVFYTGIVTPNPFAAPTPTSGGGGLATNIVNSLVPVNLSTPNNLPFAVRVERDRENPLIFAISGIYSRDVRLDSDGIPQLSATREWKEEKDSIRRRHQMRQDDFPLFDSTFGGWGDTKNSSTLTGFFTAELGYCLAEERWIFEFTEFGLSFSMSRSRSFYKSFPTPAKIIFVTVDFKVEIGLSISVVFEVEGRRHDQTNLVIIPRVDTKLSLRAALEASIVLAAASIGVFVEAGIGLEMAFSLTDSQRSGFWLDAKVEGGIDGQFRIGPRWPRWLNITWRHVFFSMYAKTQIDLVNMTAEASAGVTALWWEHGVKYPPSTRAVGATAFAVPLFESLTNEVLLEAPLRHLPPMLGDNIDIVLAGDDEFAIAAWTTLGIDFEGDYDDGLAQNFDFDQELSMGDIALLANMLDIMVAVYQNGEWTLTQLTDNFVGNMEPIIAINNERGIVVWQQMDLIADEFFDELGVANTRVLYRIFDGAEWGEANVMEVNLDGVIIDYTVALNDDMDFVIALDIFNELTNEHNIYVAHATSVDNQTTVHQLTFDQGVSNNAQVVHANGYFYIAYFANDISLDEYGNELAGASDIHIRRLDGKGVLDLGFRKSINKAASAFGLNISNNFAMFSNGSEVALAWTSFDEQFGDAGIWAVELVGDSHFSSPRLLVPAQVNTRLTVLGGSIEATGEVSVRYNVIDRSEFMYYVDELEGYFLNLEAYMMARGSDETAQVVFDNDFGVNLFINPDDVVFGRDLPIYFQVINVGSAAINRLTLTVNGSEIYNRPVNIAPGEVYAGVVSFLLNEGVCEIEYTIDAGFVTDNTAPPIIGTIYIALTNVSIGAINLTHAARGAREFSMIIHNTSNLELASTDYSVRLSFYHDFSHVLPASVERVYGDIAPRNLPTNEIIISGEELRLLDDAGLSVFVRYVFDDEDIDDASGEIYASGVRLFVRADVIDQNGEAAMQSDISANRASVLLESLLRHHQDSIKVIFEGFDGQSVVATIKNLSIQDKSLEGHELIAIQLADGRITQMLTMPAPNILGAEDSFSQHIAFAQLGDDVLLRFEPLSVEEDISSLATLSLSGIPFTLDSDAQPNEDGVIILHAYNIPNVPRTHLVAVSTNPDASIHINGHSTVGVADISKLLTQNLLYVDIVVLSPSSETTYRLYIHTDSVSIHWLDFVAQHGGFIQSSHGRWVEYGEVVPISTFENLYRFVFAGWSSSEGGAFGNIHSRSTIFTMPRNTTTLTARYLLIPPDQLSAPEITITGNVLTWNAVNNAYGYAIIVDGIRVQTVPANVREIDLFTLDLGAGRRMIQVQALAHMGISFVDSPFSRPLYWPLTIAVNPNPASINHNNLSATATVMGTRVGDITLDISDLPQGVTASVNQATAIITIAGVRPEVGQAPVVGIFDVIVTREGESVTLVVDIDLSPPDIFVVPHYVLINNDNVTSAMVIRGYAEGYIEVDASNLPSNIVAVVNQDTDTIIVTAIRPVSLQDFISGTFEIYVTRGNSRAVLPVHVNWTCAHFAFDDIQGDAWYHETVSISALFGLFRGIAPRAFAPQMQMSRAMFAMVLANLEGVDLAPYATTAARFTDVSPDAWYFSAVQWAANAGVVAGMGDGTFAPNADITREQMAVMLYHYIVLSAIPLYKSYTIPFGDYAEKSYWAVTSVEAIQAAGIIAGFPDGTFRPQESATRAEVATIFARFLVMLNNDMK